MKRAYLAMLLALTVLTLTACGGGGGDAVGNTMSSGASGGGLPMADYDLTVNESQSDGYGGFYDMEEPLEAEGETEKDIAPASRLENAKLIYTAYLDIETMDLQPCAQAIEDLAVRLGGYLESATVNSRNSGYHSGSYVVRVPSKSFQTFLKTVGEIGHVVYQEKDSQNISEAYYDTESRLTTQRTKLERLQSLLAQAENMTDLITIESAIAETELAIEQLTGELRRYDTLVDYATITINVDEVARLSSVETTPPGFAERLSKSFSGGLTNFIDVLQEIAIALAYGWMWLLILAVAVVLLLRRARGKTLFRWKKTGKSNPAESNSQGGQDTKN